MAEYIEREKAVNICTNQYKECLRKSDWCGDTVAWNIGFGIKQLPAADVVPVVHGRWVDNVDENGFLCNVWRKCSACGCLNYSKKPPYCPNCGARMDGE
jgi:hypothetical protein